MNISFNLLSIQFRTFRSFKPNFVTISSFKPSPPQRFSLKSSPFNHLNIQTRKNSNSLQRLIDLLSSNQQSAQELKDKYGPDVLNFSSPQFTFNTEVVEFIFKTLVENKEFNMMVSFLKILDIPLNLATYEMMVAHLKKDAAPHQLDAVLRSYERSGLPLTSTIMSNVIHCIHKAPRLKEVKELIKNGDQIKSFKQMAYVLRKYVDLSREGVRAPTTHGMRIGGIWEQYVNNKNDQIKYPLPPEIYPYWCPPKLFENLQTWEKAKGKTISEQEGNEVIEDDDVQEEFIYEEHEEIEEGNPIEGNPIEGNPIEGNPKEGETDQETLIK